MKDLKGKCEEFKVELRKKHQLLAIKKARSDIQ